MREGCAGVVAAASQVSIGALDAAVERLLARPVPAWDGRRHFSGPRDRTVAYLLVVDAANFCFWGGRGGYWRLAESIRDAFARGEPQLWDPARLAALSLSDLQSILEGMPLLAERLEALRELGRTAAALPRGFESLVEETAIATASGLAARLSSFADFATYRGERVPLLKRAQIAAADLAGAGVAQFPDIAELTCFPDYKLPQVLRHLGALVYTDPLARRVDSWDELASGEEAEVEIRAATVVAVERLRSALAGAGRELTSVQVDWMLWALEQEIHPMRPHHRVRTIFY